MCETFSSRMPMNNIGVRKREGVREALDHEARLMPIKGEESGWRFGGSEYSFTLRKSQQDPRAKAIC